MRNELALTGKMDKYSHIFDKLGPVESDFKPITDDELFAKERQEVGKNLADFFGFGEDFTLDQFATNFVEPTAAQIQEEFGDQLKKTEDLTARTEEENEKRYQDAQFIFQRRVAEAKKLTEPSWSQSDGYVKHDGPSGYAEKATTSRFREMDRATQSNNAPRGFGNTQSKTNNSFTNNNSTQNNQPQGTRGAMDAFGAMNAEVQGIGRQRIKGWNDKNEDEMGYFEAYAYNTPWWKKAIRKTKSFFKGKKGRITMKVGALLALNMGMAVYSKRYEFENGKQMAAMFALMMTSFFITRELSEEGIELGGFGY